MKEIWLPIWGFSNYDISNLGRVKSKARLIVSIDGKTYRRKEKLLQPKKHKDGYLFVQLTEKKKRTNLYIHRLVAQAFIPNQENKPLVNHIDGNKRNNLPENLEWATSKENAVHAYQNGFLYPLETSKPNSQAVVNLQTGECYRSIKNAAKALERNYSVVRDMLKGRRKKTLPLEYCEECST